MWCHLCCHFKHQKLSHRSVHCKMCICIPTIFLYRYITIEITWDWLGVNRALVVIVSSKVIWWVIKFFPTLPRSKTSSGYRTVFRHHSHMHSGFLAYNQCRASYFAKGTRCRQNQTWVVFFSSLGGWMTPMCTLPAQLKTMDIQMCWQGVLRGY